MVVDALDLCYSKEHIDMFALRLGRQRLLAARLQAQGERQARHRLRREELDVGPARQHCDEFIYYDDLIRVQKRTQTRQQAEAGEPERRRSRCRQAKQEAFDRLVETVTSLERTTTRSGARCVKQT